jgi:hypothetical protein
MGIMVTKDEADKRLEGMKAERQKIVSSGRSERAITEELVARESELSRTAVLNPDPRKSYHLANKDQKGRVGILKGLGYKPTDPKGKAQLVTGEEVDGAQTHGDLMLMETPVENYERRRGLRMKRQAAIAEEHAEASQETINQIARDGGLVGPHQEAAFDDSRDG